MAQQQIKGDTGTVDGSGSFTTYTVPSSSLITPNSISVNADGSGASGNFLPCLTFRTITGAIIARCPAPGVAAGASSEVSWFSGRSVSGGTTGVVSETCYLSGVHSAPVSVASGGTGVRVPWLHFQTTDSSIFGTDTSPVASPPYNNQPGDQYLYFTADGAYFVTGVIGMAGGAYSQIGEIQNDGGQWVLDQTSDRPRLGEGLTTNVFTDPGGGTDVLTPFSSRMFYVDSTSPVGILSLGVFQGSGSNKSLNFASLGIFYLGGATADLGSVY